MLRKAMHVLLGTIFVALLGGQSAWAVSFGKVDVASKMGEPFYAEAPLLLNDTESLKEISVELGSSADYRILEVYRNPVLNAIRTDIVDDERGARVTLSSDAVIDEAFFNLILKVRHGRSTHYKKVPVFLDVPSLPTSGSAVALKPLPVVDAANVDASSSSAFVSKVPAVKNTKEAFDTVEEDNVEPVDAFKPYDNWARTSRYGPMVYGDTITTVAKRLRLDDRFTNKQVMVALFNKNKAQFSKNNINLIKAGSYLDVPSATEVAQVSPESAKQFLSKQAKVWKAMQKQSKYAALAEAQKNRYSSRVRIGKNATGMAKQPTSLVSPNRSKALNSDDRVQLSNEENQQSQGIIKALEKKLVEKDAAFSALQERMTALESKLTQDSGRDTVGNDGALDANAAALEAQNKKLELVITRLKNKLDQAKTNEASGADADTGWMLWALIGLAVLVLSLLAALLLLMRKGREHPADKNSLDNVLESEPVAAELPASDATAILDADDFDMPHDVVGNVNDIDASVELFGNVDGELEEIPDLTDEETGEMEPFNADEAPDPNVNYLEDADVYLRYGMEDEAEAQVRMALKLQDDNPEAHAKMVKIQQAKGDESAVSSAMATAKTVLTGAALAKFETTISQEDSVAEALAGATFDDLPVKDEAESGTDTVGDLNVDSLDFEKSADVVLDTSSEDGSVDFDFGDLDSTSNVVDKDALASSSGDMLPDLDIDFDLSDMDEDKTTSDDGLSSDGLNSAELDEISVTGIETSDVEEFVDALEKKDDKDFDESAMDALDFDDFELGETSEVELGSATQFVSTDGSDPEALEGLNDFEIAKARDEIEAEKNDAAVELDMGSDDPFATAKTALEEKKEEEAAEDWDIASLGMLTGEEDDELSLTDEKSIGTGDDGTAEVELEDLDISLDSIELDDVTKTSVADETDVDLDSDANIGLDDLDMDFDLPDLDADEPKLDILSDENDSTFIMDAASATESSEASVEESLADATDVDLDSDANTGLDDLDMDFDLPDLDADEPKLDISSDENDSTFIMDAASATESSEASVEESLADATDIDLDSDANIGLDDLDMDFDLPDLDADEPKLDISSDENDSTFIMDAASATESSEASVEESLADATDVDLDSATNIDLDDLDMDFDLPDLDADEPKLDISSDENDSTFMMDAASATESSEASVEESLADATDVDLDSDANIGLDDLDMDFDLPDLDAAKETDKSVMDIDVSMDSASNIDFDDLNFDLPNEDSADISIVHHDDSTEEAENEIELSDLDGSTIDALDSGLDDLDISTTTVDPVLLGYTGDTEANAFEILSDLDADLSELEMHEESVITDVHKLKTEADPAGSVSEDIMLNDDLDKTFVLNDVAKNKAMLDEGAAHFDDLDSAMAGASSVSEEPKDPMLGTFSSTQELENVHTEQHLSTVGASDELDELLKDLDGLLDEDEDKK